MNLMIVRAKVKAENVAEVEAAAGKMFAAINQAQPSGVSYASGKLPDGETFVAVLALADPTANPLTTIPEFLAFQESLKGWLAETPVLEQLEVVGSYGLFDDVKTQSVS